MSIQQQPPLAQTDEATAIRVAFQEEARQHRRQTQLILAIGVALVASQLLARWLPLPWLTTLSMFGYVVFMLSFLLGGFRRRERRAFILRAAAVIGPKLRPAPTPRELAPCQATPGAPIQDGLANMLGAMEAGTTGWLSPREVDQLRISTERLAIQSGPYKEVGELFSDRLDGADRRLSCALVSVLGSVGGSQELKLLQRMAKAKAVSGAEQSVKAAASAAANRLEARMAAEAPGKRLLRPAETSEATLLRAPATEPLELGLLLRPDQAEMEAEQAAGRGE